MNVRSILTCLFGGILVAMIAVTVWAGSRTSLWEGGGALLDNPWGVATLADAYFGFLTFFVWVAYKERRWAWRLVWLALILCLGNIAMSAYVLLQLARLPRGGSMTALLLRSEP
jgi:Protein of unknown function (DUF1475)